MTLAHPYARIYQFKWRPRCGYSRDDKYDFGIAWVAFLGFTAGLTVYWY